MSIKVKKLGLVPYSETFEAMQKFTNQRIETSSDELWSLQHPPVFTQGLAGKAEHLLFSGEIPVYKTDRGGQITYHGPGQIVIYPLLRLKNYQLSVRGLVNLIEQSIINVLKTLEINAYQKNHAPGVYVEDAKIASLGLKIRKGCSYHGLSLNADMNLSPFQQINPCGLTNQMMTQVSNFNKINLNDLEQQLIAELLTNLGYNAQQINHALTPS